MAPQTQPTRLGTEDTVVDESSPQAPASGLARGATIARYTVLGEVGRGAMGTVYAAYDPQLDRRIALKVLHATGGQEGAQRLMREARALARFTHPNVVIVHDVGVASGRGFIATEFIEGGTLSDWLNAEPRSTEAILQALVDAGRGLAAAHEAGLIHRDFKPQNVMITTRGRVVVMDFGLARSTGADGDARPRGIEASPTDPIELERSPGPDLDLTSTGMVMGTPVYMSLEQHCGASVTPASDQYSFCVTAFEALCGERPFGGGTRMEIARAIRDGPRAPWSSARSVPTRVRRAIERGLHADPEERWPDMQALLEELAPPRQRTFGPRASLLGGGAIVVSGVVGFVLASGSSDSACADVEAPIEAAWSPSRRDRLESAFAATGLSYAGETAQRVVGHLDAYAERWRAGRSEACGAHHVEKLQSATVHDARTRCLERGLLELDTLVGLLTTADEAVVSRATDAVLGLPDLSRCADVDALLDQTPRPDDDRAARAVDGARAAVVEARAYRLAGEYEEATRRLELAEQRGEEAGVYLPLAAELALARGELLLDQSRFPEAAEALERAHLDARRSGHRDVALRSSMQLIYVTGYRLARYEEADLWSRIARAEADREGAETRHHAQILSWSGIPHGRRGNFERARALYLDAKSMFESLGVRDHAGYDAVFTNLGLVSNNLGDTQAAEGYLLEARRRNIERYGPRHPLVARATLNLANAALRRGDVPEANARAEEALELGEASLPPMHVTLGHAHDARAKAALAAGELDRAWRSIEAAAPILEAALGADHPAVAEAYTQRAEILRVRGRLDDASRDATRARRMLIARFGNADARTADATSVLAMTGHAAGDVEQAQALADEVLETLPAGTPNSAVPRARAYLVRAALDAEVDPDSASEHRARARAALESSGAVGAHLLAHLVEEQ